MRYFDPDGRATHSSVYIFSNESMINELKKMQKQVLDDPDSKQGGGGPYKRTDAGITARTTWCNQATFKISRVTDPDLAKSMYNKDDSTGDNTNARSIYSNLKTAAEDPNSMIIEITAEAAQKFANLGITVIGVKDTEGIGHVATVAPGYDFDKVNGPMMANVGGKDKQGYTRAKSAFRSTYYEDGKVHFYINKQSILKLNIVIVEE